MQNVAREDNALRLLRHDIMQIEVEEEIPKRMQGHTYHTHNRLAPEIA